MMPEQPDIRRNETAHARLWDAMERLRHLAPVGPLRGVQNVNELFRLELTHGDRIAIACARWIGSWYFIIGQSVFVAGWTGLNIVGWVRHWDPYPFILMGLFLSLQAAYTAPLIIMAQNREAAKDRLMLHEDYETNRRAAEEIRQVLNILEQHSRLLELVFEDPRQGLVGENSANGRDQSRNVPTGNGAEPRSAITPEEGNYLNSGG